MTTDKALDLALEALESIQRYGLDTLSGRADGPDDRAWQREGVNEMTKRATVAITAIKQARSAPVQEPVAWKPEDYGYPKTYEPPAAQPAPAPGYCKHCKQYSIEEPLPAAPVQEKWGASAVMNPDYVAAQKEKSQQALDVMAENARKLGLDYEPVQDSTCNETLRAQGKAYPRTCRKCGLGPCIGAPKQPPAQPAPAPGYCKHCKQYSIEEPLPAAQRQCGDDK